LLELAQHLFKPLPGLLKTGPIGSQPEADALHWVLARAPAAGQRSAQPQPLAAQL
jgi:hypothetical protein